MTQPDPSVSEEVTAAVAFGALEAAIATLVLELYTAWLDIVATAVLAAFARFGLPPDPTAVWSTVPAWERLLGRLMDSLEQIAKRGWDAAAEQLGVNVAFNPSDPFVVDMLARSRNHMVRTPDEVYRRIIDALGKAAAAGATVEEQAARVRHILDVTGTENWPARAQTVAVTEVHRAWNMGYLALGLRVQTMEQRQLKKRWDSREDRRTRPAHEAADGQIVAASDPFIVAGEQLLFPADPGGSPSNVINCRCKMNFRRS